jgi:hypothetical protein
MIIGFTTCPAKKKQSQKSTNQIKLYKAPTLGWVTMPNKITVQLKYVDNGYVSPGVSTVGVHSYRINDLYDPDYTGIGHQPRGFDQWMAFFFHFTVIKVTVKTTFSTAFEIADQTRNVVGLYISDTATPPPSLNSYQEGRNSYWKTMASSPESPCEVKLTKTVDIGNFLGRTNIVNSDDCAGSTSSFPNESVFCHTFGASQSTADDPPPIRYVTELIFTAVLHGPKDPGQS